MHFFCSCSRRHLHDAFSFFFSDPTTTKEPVTNATTSTKPTTTTTSTTTTTPTTTTSTTSTTTTTPTTPTTTTTTTTTSTTSSTTSSTSTSTTPTTTTTSTTPTTTTPTTTTSTTTTTPTTTSTTTTAAPTTTLPSFEEVVTIPTTPPPEPVYILPKESLQDVRYISTANHYWTFWATHDESWIKDLAPNQNPLSEAVYDRFHNFDRKLTQPGPIRDDVDNPSKSIFTALNGPIGTPPRVIMQNGLQPGLGKSVLLGPGSAYVHCFPLVEELERERYYLRQCLLSAGGCDYGLSLSVWIQFLSNNVTSKEVILATGPETARGFQLYLGAGELGFELWTETTKWSITAPFQKTSYEWVNIAVAWGKSTETLQLFVNRNMVAQKTNYVGTNYLGNNEDPRTLWLGCTVDRYGSQLFGSSTLGMKISTVAMWYWPIKLTQLFTGGQERYLLELPEETTTPAPSTPPPDFVDYTYEMEEFVPLPGQTYAPNPMYTAADLYISMQAELKQIEFENAVWEPASERNLYCYKLVSRDGYVKLHTFEANRCPATLDSCIDGLSIGIWINIPTNMDTEDLVLDILELVGAFRISIFKQTLNIFTEVNKTTTAFRIVEVVPRDVWFNLGLSISVRKMHPKVKAYFNGLAMHVLEVSAPTRKGTMRQEEFAGVLLFGSYAVENGATDISLNDLVVWYRALADFEKHRFLGYERAQLDQLQGSSYYWTPDLYILQDSASQLRARRKYSYFTSVESISETGVVGYALASLYKPRSAKFRFSAVDYMRKSRVPIFDMKSNHYMMLGRRKATQLTTADLLWTKQCLLDPSEGTCGLRGFAISIWIKLISVSEGRLRFYLNSGDPGTGGLTLTDHRGVAIFSDASLLGVSLSQRFTAWKLILDSNSYTLGQWINIGILWREDLGLTLLLDGVNYGTTDVKGSKMYRARVASPYVVLGRFNVDDKSTWLSPSEANAEKQKSDGRVDPGWEMANFALGEVTYFNKLLTQQEYNTQMGLLGVARFRRFSGNLWFGKNLIDAPVAQLSAAARANIGRPGPTQSSNPFASVKFLEEPAAAQLLNGSSIRLGVFPQTHCTRLEPFCPEGLSVGAWIRLGGLSVTPNPDIIILFTGAGGRFGMAVNTTGTDLGVWMQEKSGVLDPDNAWLCMVRTVDLWKATMNMQWIHYSLVWGPQPGTNERVLRLIMNGRELESCSRGVNNPATVPWFTQATRNAAKLYTDTATNESAYMLISSAVSTSQVDVALVALKPTTVVGSALMDLIGVEYPQFLAMQIATFYWPFSGLMKQLAPHRLTPVRVEYAHDKQDTVMGAMCTDGTDQSFVALRGDQVNQNGKTNLETACLINPTGCESYVFMIEYRPLNMSFQPGAARELFRSAPQEAPENTVGLEITVSPDGELLVVTARSGFYTLTNSVPMSNLTQSSKWIKLEVFYTADALKIRNAGILLATTKDSSKKLEMNRPLTSEERLNLRLTVGRGLAVCVSDVSTLDVPSGQDAEALINGGSATYCYPDTDYLADLKGTEADHLGLPRAATNFQVLIERLHAAGITCLYEPERCSSITISLWTRIDGFFDLNAETVKLGASSEVVAVLFSTGPPETRGILVTVHGRENKDDRKLDLRAVVQTGGELWQVESLRAVTLGEWINIGLHWYPSDETKSGGFEIYLDGLRKQSSTLPRTKAQYPAVDPGAAGIYFSHAYARLPDGDANLKMYTLNGSVEHFAYWTSTSISCSRPRSTKQRLLGECSIDSSVPESVLCTVLRDCMQADGAVCMDPTFTNLYRMAAQAEWLSDPADFNRLLTMALDVKNTVISGTSPNNSTVAYHTPEFVYAVVLIMRAWPLGLNRACETMPSKHCDTMKQTKVQIIELLMQVAEAVTDYKLESAWLDLMSEGLVEPTEVLNSMTAVIRAVTDQLGTSVQCEDELHTVTRSGSATISAINTKPHCPEKMLTWRAKTLLARKTLGTGSFQMHNKLFRDGILNKGLVSLIGIPASNDEAKLVAGGLRRDTFTTSALKGPIDITSETTRDLSDPVLALRQPATALKIQSPVYLFDTNQPSGVLPIEGDNSTFKLHFVIQMARDNEFQDAYFYRTTGRRKWKAVETVRQHESGSDANLTLAFPVRCVFWDSRGNSSKEAIWNDEGCLPTEGNLTHVHCACTHNSAFAVAMEPPNAPGRKKSIWITWGISDEKEHDQVMKILLLTTNAISLACSLAFFCTIVSYMVRSTFQDVYIIHSVMCIALISFHSALIAEPFVESSKLGCRAVSVLVHASAMLIASWLFCETVALFRCFVLGDFSSKRFWTWFFGLVSPVTVIILPTALSQFGSHGDDVLCFPGRESYVFWTMFGTIFAYSFISIIVCLIIGCNIETPAYMKPKLIEKLIQRASQLNFLTLFHAAAWVAIVFVLMIPVPYLPYAAFMAISLMGTLCFVLLDLGDVDLRKFYCGKYSDYAGAKDDGTDKKSDATMPGTVHHDFSENYMTYDAEELKNDLDFPKKSFDLEAAEEISTHKRH